MQPKTTLISTWSAFKLLFTLRIAKHVRLKIEAPCTQKEAVCCQYVESCSIITSFICCMVVDALHVIMFASILNCDSEPLYTCTEIMHGPCRQRMPPTGHLEQCRRWQAGCRICGSCV